MGIFQSFNNNGTPQGPGPQQQSIQLGGQQESSGPDLGALLQAMQSINNPVMQMPTPPVIQQDPGFQVAQAVSKMSRTNSAIGTQQFTGITRSKYY